MQVRTMEKTALGILAHVDAGKTTLSEGILYLTGALRTLGRVDHEDSFLDHEPLERSRGITIFSKQAVFCQGDREFTILDTPGHVDFSAEMERCLWVMDYAVLVISGPDGIQGHTETLWQLLKTYRIPVFLFINKMDQPGTDRDRILEELRRGLDSACIPFDGDKEDAAFLEDIAMCDEAVLDTYMEKGRIPRRDICRLIKNRQVFPCYFGSALKLTGVETLLAGLEQYTLSADYPQDFRAKVYKITRDDQGNRLTHLKVTGGTLAVRQSFGDKEDREKVSQIRVYSGAKYETPESVPAGTVCAVTGLNGTFAGQGLGGEPPLGVPAQEPVMSCRLLLPEGTDTAVMMKNLRQLEEEEPELHPVWDSHLGEIQLKLMGEVQTEILKSRIKERFGTEVTFGPGRILYKETIRNKTVGVGHYEPLRHYAEVHLLLEPGEPGSGLVFASSCSEDELDGNWQRLILTHLAEKEHRGVLAGMPITDMKITLTAGRAHVKHTEGGDFRQATYRAVRQGLMQAESVLLEPWYRFRLELPADQVGRGMADVQKMGGSFEPVQQEGDLAVLCGSAPVSEMVEYQAEVRSYTGGRGRLSLKRDGYRPCHNAEEVIEELGYDCEADPDNPSGSIFCAHGAGFSVPWNEVPEYMHIKEKAPVETEIPAEEWVRALTQREKNADISGKGGGSADKIATSGSGAKTGISGGQNRAFDGDDKELEAIMRREFGEKKQQEDRYSGYRKSRTVSAGPAAAPPPEEKEADAGRQYLLVDGYNMIFSWEFLDALSKESLEAARQKLMDILCNYQGFTGLTIILVFDAYKVKGNPGEVFRYHNIYVVYTKEAELADTYIEKTTHELGRKYQVTVATSDGLEQVVVMGQGARRMSARDFQAEMERTDRELRRLIDTGKPRGENYLFDHMDTETAALLEEVRLGRTDLGNS